jgi:hypothetical protein
LPAATSQEVEAFVADRLRVSAEGTFLANYNFVPASRVT